ncbi:TerD family protein [Gordonia rubripertincta]|uniref:TerD family protein n=1 Tax=Gordonia rubripertincta TaxID=36822 RepID=A0ABT4MXG4_GORRU|nr:TerD family protein [Gordonia rubripertincta]MCZ4550706.1 TerD family protein [Gordonia rubripertincta]
MSELVRGQNVPVEASTVVFSVAGGTSELDLVGLVVGPDLRTRHSDGVVFYNQPQTTGVRLEGHHIDVDLGTLPPDAIVLCAVSGDAEARLASGLTAELDGVPDKSRYSFPLHPLHGETALLCFELYQRSGRWRVRALGQGYQGGLAALLTAHGVEVDDAPDVSPRAPAEPVPVAPQTGDGHLPPALVTLGSDYGAAVARAHVVFEDAARSAAGYVQAEGFAMDRLDRELGDLLADPAQRNSPAADRARAAAQQRCDDLVTSAKSRFDADSAVLMAELAALDPQLPPAMASWASPAWNRANSPSVGGLRIGELFAPERGDLRLPFCVPTPIARPLWVLDAGDPVLPVVTSLVLRLVVAARVPFPGMRNSSTGGQVLIDVFDLTGSLAPMTEMLMPMLTAPAVTAPESVADRLSVLESSIDLTQMALQAREVDDIDTRVVVIADLPFGWDVAALARLVRIADRGSELGWAFVFAGSLDDSDNDPLVSTIADRTMMIPVTDEARAHDPWVGLPWSVAAERIDPTGTQARQIVATLSSDQPRSGANPNA